jgi:dTDP-4-amino-4,6-dideoxygalactose transaminase
MAMETKRLLHDEATTTPPIIVPSATLSTSTIPQGTSVTASIGRILASGTLTNGPVVEELEERAAAYLDVRHCIAVSSGAAALTVTLRSLDVTGEVILSALATPAMVHAVHAADLEPVLADIDPSTFAVTPASVGARIGTRTGAVLASHPFGTPCDAVALAAAAARQGVRVIFDAASAFGAEHAGKKVGTFGDAEIFSLYRTKTLIGGEGGLVATNDDRLAERCRRAREQVDGDQHPSRLVCMNARMSELHAAVALASFDTLQERLDRRRRLVGEYRRALEEVDGISMPIGRRTDLSTYAELTVTSDPEVYGGDVERLVNSLRERGVDAHRILPVPVHHMEMFRTLALPTELPGTELASSQGMSLPLRDAMRLQELDFVVSALRRVAPFP